MTSRYDRLHDLVMRDVRCNKSWLCDLQDTLHRIAAGWLRFDESIDRGSKVFHHFDGIQVRHEIDGRDHHLGFQVLNLPTDIHIMTDGSLPPPSADEEGRRRVLTMIEDLVTIVEKALAYDPRDADASGDRFVNALCAMRPRRDDEKHLDVVLLMRGPWTPFGLGANGNGAPGEPALAAMRSLAKTISPAGVIAPMRATLIHSEYSDGRHMVAVLPTRRRWTTPDEPMTALRDLDELNRRIASGTPWED